MNPVYPLVFLVVVALAVGGYFLFRPNTQYSATFCDISSCQCPSGMLPTNTPSGCMCTGVRHLGQPPPVAPCNTQNTCNCLGREIPKFNPAVGRFQCWDPLLKNWRPCGF